MDITLENLTISAPTKDNPSDFHAIVCIDGARAFAANGIGEGLINFRPLPGKENSRALLDNAQDYAATLPGVGENQGQVSMHVDMDLELLVGGLVEVAQR